MVPCSWNHPFGKGLQPSCGYVGCWLYRQGTFLHGQIGQVRKFKHNCPWTFVPRLLMFPPKPRKAKRIAKWRWKHASNFQERSNIQSNFYSRLPERKRLELYNWRECFYVCLTNQSQRESKFLKTVSKYTEGRPWLHWVITLIQSLLQDEYRLGIKA